MIRFTAHRGGPAPWWCRAAACLLAAVLGTLAVLGPARPAAAHAGVVLTLHGDGRGSVWVTVVWQDGHPVTEAVGMTLMATSPAAPRVGPVALQRNGQALTYPGTLTPGDWTVVADMGTPAIGRCEGLLRVAPATATPTPQEITCAPPPAAAPPPTTRPRQSFVWVWYLLGVAVAGGLIVYGYLRRR